MDVIVNGVDKSTNYTPAELAAIYVEQRAWDGEVGVGSAPIPDPAGTFEPYADQQFKLAVGSDVVIDGFVGPTDTDRGDVAAGTRVTTTYMIRDENAVLYSRRYIGNRPAESDQARVLAIVAATGLSLGTSNVLGTHLVTVPAKRYRASDVFNELMDDLIAPTGKTMYVVNGELHWHLPSEGGTSTVSIDDVAGDGITSFTLDAATPPQRSKDPLDLRNDVEARSDTGVSVTVSDATSITRHDSAGVKHQELILEDGDTTYLTAIANARLAEAKDERITYSGTVGPITAAQAALFVVGEQLPVTNAAVWRLTSATKRIASKRVRYRHPDQFYVSLELGHPIRRRRPTHKDFTNAVKNTAGTGTDSGGPGGGGSDCGCPPYVATAIACTGTDLGGFGLTSLQDAPRSWDIASTGSTIHPLSTPSAPTYFMHPDGSTEMIFLTYPVPAVAGDIVKIRGHLGVQPMIGSFSGGFTATATVFQGAWGSGTPVVVAPQGTPLAERAWIVPVGGGVSGEFDMLITVAAGDIIQLGAYSTDPAPGVSGAAYDFAASGFVVCTGGTGTTGTAPTTGQEVSGESVGSGDGSQTRFNTAYPFKAGSLHVFVNGIENNDDVTVISAATGDFVFAHPPLTDADITVRYVAA